MSLPPPPGWPPASPTPTGPDGSDRLDERPRWRQGRPGFALLHVVIGVGIWLGSLFLFVLALALAGWSDRDFETHDAFQDDISALALLVASMIGWMSFAYGRGSRGQRWLLLAGLIAGTLFVSIGITLPTEP